MIRCMGEREIVRRLGPFVDIPLYSALRHLPPVGPVGVVPRDRVTSSRRRCALASSTRIGHRPLLVGDLPDLAAL